MGMSALSGQKEQLDCYDRLEHMIKTGDIGAVKMYTEDNNLTHAHYKKYTNHTVGTYPVTVAARCGNVVILNYLLSVGFRAHKSRCRTTPMLEACKHGHIAVVKVLVELHGVDVNEIYFPRPSCSVTALSTAASAGQLETFQYLLKMGAFVEPVDNAKREILLYSAVGGQNVEIVKILSQYIDANFVAKPLFMTSLILAATHKNEEILTALLDAGADIEGNESTSYSRDTPFNAAIFSGKFENAKILYSKGANPKVRSKRFGCTPLKYAIQWNRYEMVRCLVVELNLPWEDDLDPLDVVFQHSSSWPYQFRSVIKLLIDADFSSNERSIFHNMCRYNIPKEVTCELYAFLEETVTNPRTLKQLCCFKVRRLLGRNLSRVVDTIPLPRPLIEFVKLTHIPLKGPTFNVIMIDCA